MDPEERLRRFEDVRARLIEDGGDVAVVVEGTRDAAALRELGVTGEVLVYNRGETMNAFADRLRTRGRLIVFFDWDRKGGQLARLLLQQLGGAVRLDLDLRKEFARVSLVKCVEDLPAAWRTLSRRASERRDSGA